MTVLADFLGAALVMGFWVLVAFGLAFIGVFVMNLIGERVYGKKNRDERSRR
jgi:hypothetical protein